jgi:hypothetical protein
MIISDQRTGKSWKGSVTVIFGIISQYMPEGTELNEMIPHTGFPVSGLRMNQHPPKYEAGMPFTSLQHSVQGVSKQFLRHNIFFHWHYSPLWALTC